MQTMPTHLGSVSSSCSQTSGPGLMISLPGLSDPPRIHSTPHCTINCCHCFTFSQSAEYRGVPDMYASPALDLQLCIQQYARKLLVSLPCILLVYCGAVSCSATKCKQVVSIGGTAAKWAWRLCWLLWYACQSNFLQNPAITAFDYEHSITFRGSEVLVRLQPATCNLG